MKSASTGIIAKLCKRRWSENNVGGKGQMAICPFPPMQKVSSRSGKMTSQPHNVIYLDFAGRARRYLLVPPELLSESASVSEDAT
jgi:hypothetical protein